MAEPAPDEALLSPDTHNWWAPQRRRAWFAIAGAPAAWFTHLTGGWWVTGAACLDGTGYWGPLSPRGVWWLEALVAAVCIGTAVAALWVALLEWRASDNTDLGAIQASARPDYVAAVALLVSAAFLLAVVYDGIAPLMLPLCEAIR